MKFCPKCGVQTDDTAVVCPQCGFLFENQAQPQQPQYQQSQFQQAPYQQPQYGQPNVPVAPKNNVFAIVSLICGIAGCTLCCSSLIVQILAVVFGFMAAKKIKESNGMEQGENYAKIGKILGFVGIGIGVIFWIVYIVALVAGVLASSSY